LIRHKLGLQERVVLPIFEDFSPSFGLQFVRKAVDRSLEIGGEVLLHIDVSGYSYPRAFDPFLTALILHGQVIDHLSGQMFSVPVNSRLHIAIEFGFGQDLDRDPKITDTTLGAPMTAFISHLVGADWKGLMRNQIEFTSIHSQWPLPVLATVETETHVVGDWNLGTHDKDFKDAASLIHVYCKEFLENGAEGLNRGFQYNSVQDLLQQRSVSSEDVAGLWNTLREVVNKCPLIKESSFNGRKFALPNDVTPLRIRIFCISFERFLKWFFEAFSNKESFWKIFPRLDLDPAFRNLFKNEHTNNFDHMTGMPVFEKGLLETLLISFALPNGILSLQDVSCSFRRITNDTENLSFALDYLGPAAPKVSILPAVSCYEDLRSAELGTSLITKHI
jgi:hypothetical protein